mmetsp:Transcript_2343/g.5242  ORF Transcript_2343/g.5242 Transcript_2343/m.5242 type:complete len:259 (-) Transcript_2343:256-1032(-)|eukprot:CAMPEP_0182523882 /NCGR_PEP_ID=MMETSP1323-20130603/1396_1 /TAXON_ID=236787 /ORGANISM="Florenciella parvula, Strain RCC1693" /LENGTH=258 /DNA_ID=CAMNT_0024732355 /DNA_START=79 /DNA_END=855 /DNA_ORIENTATION=-
MMGGLLKMVALLSLAAGNSGLVNPLPRRAMPVSGALSSTSAAVPSSGDGAQNGGGDAGSTGKSGGSLAERFWNFESSDIEAATNRRYTLGPGLEFEEAFQEWFWTSGGANAGAQAAVFRNDPRGVILFDGVCNFCDASVNFFMEHDRDPEKGSYRFAAQQSSIGQSLLQQESGKTAEDLQSIVLITEDGLYCKSDAVLRIGKDLQEPFPTLAKLGGLVPRPVRDQVYEFVSANRGILGTKDSCRILDENEVARFLKDT